MVNRILSLLAIMVFLAACETASRTSGDASGSGVSSSGGESTVTSESTASESSVSSGSTVTGGSGSESAVSSDLLEDLVTIGDRVLFAYDSSALSAAAKSTLSAQAVFLNNNPSLLIVVEGHTDERGTREYNIALGHRRAVAVRDYLVSQGVDSVRIRTISYGKEKRAVLGSNEGAWAQNRRAVSVTR